MPDLFINPLNVEPVNNPQNGQIALLATGYSNEAINAGQTVYVDQDTGLLNLTISAGQFSSSTVGMATTSAAGPFQQVTIAVAGDVFIGTGSIGNVVVLGSGAGGVEVGGNSIPIGVNPSLVGIIIQTNYLRLVIINNNGTYRTV